MLHEREMKMPQNIEVYDLLISCPSDVSHYLDVIEKMPNGYHELETVMQSIDIFDIVTLRAEKGTGEISVGAIEGKQRMLFAVPHPRNTAYRAAKLSRRTLERRYACGRM